MKIVQTKLFTAFASAILITAVNNAHGRVASTTLEALTKSADAIAVAKVDRVTRIGGVKVAQATVIRPLKGLSDKQQFAFLAEKTWTCDMSHAVKGETVLIFLSKLNSRGFLGDFLNKHPQFESEKTKHLKNVPFYQIAHAGQGRMTVLDKDGIDYLTARESYYAPTKSNEATFWIHQVQLPSDLHVYPHSNSKQPESRLVLLKEVEKRVTKFLKEADSSLKVRR